MKAVILAGGLGTRISEETELKPKPMVEIGHKPILWHIMKMYSVHGINDFIICCGYKGYVIKEYFANYFLHMSDVTFNLKNNSFKVHENKAEPWSVTLVDTGDNSMTGGRLKRIHSFVKNEELFCFTYGDGVSNQNIKDLVKFHLKHKKIATMTVVRPPVRFGEVTLKQNKVIKFIEKPQIKSSWINGGFFVFNKKIFDFLNRKDEMLERRPMEKLYKKKELIAFKHHGFWQCMDTQRDKELLKKLIRKKTAPWIK